MGLTVTTPAEEEPVSVDEAKLHLRVTANDDDDLIATLITAARQSLDAATGRIFVSTALRYTLAQFPCDGIIRLPRGNVSAVGSVKYLDSNGAEQTLASPNYVLAGDEVCATITRAVGTAWPVTRCHPEAIRIAFTAGWADATTVPAAIKAAIKLLVGDFYENREARFVGNSVVVANDAVAALVGPYTVTEAA